MKAERKRVRFLKKLVVVLEEGTPKATAINVVGHLMASAGFYAEGLIGEEVVDLSGQRHLGLPKYPFVCLAAEQESLQEIVRKGKSMNIVVVDFPRQALDILTDEELVADVSGREASSLEYWGVALYGKRGEVASLTGAMRLYRG